ncbi:hypothetical protein CRI94_07540 [Longibacter salinarum]|uniref:Uncharacterized protein n=1 Tax=Longibacter salinarum TaxID=1850348 RepID=A0A2A8CZ47_9BACT|nr:DUF4175 family protein [Longibacter salinarum]PEN13900.1 hypothetical protein CRI94_07540 [Longibacter salinarum]
MSEQTAQLVEHLRARLRDTLRRITLAQVVRGASVVLGVAAAIWLIATAVEAGFWLNQGPRTVLTGVTALLVLGVSAVFLARPVAQLIGLWSQPSEESVARTVGERYPEVSDRLLNLLQLAGGSRSHAPDAMVDAAVRRLSEDVQTVPFEQTEDFAEARKAARMASLPIVGVLAFLLVAPSTFLGASQRLLAPGTTFQRPAPFTVDVYPGDVRLIRGDSLSISVRAAGDVPDELQLDLRPTTDAPSSTITLRADTAGIFRHTLASVREDIDYRITAGRVETGWFRADVEARPLVRGLQLRVQPPRYTGLPERAIDANVGDVTGLPGSTVRLQADVAGPELDSAAVVFEDSSTISLNVADRSVTGQFPITGDGQYHIVLHSANGVANRDPIRYRISTRPDARPSIAFLAPEPDAKLEEDLVASLRLRMRDDFGFSKLRLHYRLAEQRFGEGQKEFSSIELPLENPRQVDQVTTHDWLLAQESGLDLVPGDVVEYYVEVWDNDGFAGAKSSRTGTQRLRLASLTEKYRDLDETQEETASDIENLREEASDVKRQFNELRDEVRRKQDASWEDRRQLERLKKQQESVEKSVSDLAKKVEDMTRQMQEENLTSPETAQKFEELQRVIEEINSPELMDALKQMQESMENLDLRQMQKAMEDFEFNEEQYRQRLDRTLELFKQLRRSQKMEELSRRLDELGQTEQKLSEKTSERMNEQADEQDTDPQDDAERADENAPDEASSPENQEAASQEDAGQQSEGNPSEQSEEKGSENQQANDQNTPSDESGEQKAGANEDLAREQDRARERMQELMKEMQELSEQMQSSPQAPNEQMRQMQQRLKQQDMPEQMKQNSQQLRKDQLQDAQSGQQQMQQQLQQMSQQMQQMKQGMSGQKQQMNIAGIHRALQATLRLSERQESLRGTVRELSADSPTLRTYAPNQEQLKSGLLSVSDSIQALAKQIPQMKRVVQKESGDALREMNRATEALTERNAAQASSTQKASMTHLNELALLLADLLKQMQNAQGGGGGQSMQQMLQQMQQMSGQQQKLNRQVQQFLNDMQGNRLSVDQKERLQQMARQQAEIKKKLDELGKENGMRNQVLGDLDRIAEQMEETIRELQRGQQNSRTVERQQQILTRLLNAQRSLRKQGKDDRREGREPGDYERRSPADLTPQEEIEQLRRDLIRALDSGYAPDYERLIKRYFELLEENEE